MLTLGIESTCDETGIAVLRGKETILSNCISSQVDLHARYGGVVPEVACRRHVDVCRPLLDLALREAGVGLEEIDLIAVARGPGLIGALLIGLHFAQGLGLALGKPVIGVNHLEAHLYAAMMERQVPLPALGVVLSGGHTALVKIEELGTYTLIGETQDDAMGEAFDKVASILGLPYPGGPEIERLARSGKEGTFPFRAGRIKGRPFDFSFSGLKTAALYAARGQKSAPLQVAEADLPHFAASFQAVACEDVVSKALAAAEAHGCRSLVFGGGVTQNTYLRTLFERRSPLPLFWPPKGLSLDNGAMIAGLGHFLYPQETSLDPLPRIPFAA